MEHGRYWMWAKAKPGPDINPRLLTPMNSCGDSWEEQAFAEDAAGALGGCVWPPRSYSCSFCRREFRSAQALGGHMNVHRRDRARLKQSSNSPPEVVPQSHALNTCTSYEPPYSCTFLYSNPKPNPDQFSDSGTLVPVSPLIRVSSPPSNTEEKISTGLSFFPPALVLKDRDSDVISPQPPSWSSFLSEKRGRPCIQKGVDLEARVEKDDCVTEDLSRINMNLAQNSDEEVASCKRRRIEAKVPLISLQRCVPQSEVSIKLCVAGSTEELDLELRLGNAPKVK